MPPEPAQLQTPTPITVHAMLVLYEADEITVNEWATKVEKRRSGPTA